MHSHNTILLIHYKQQKCNTAWKKRFHILVYSLLIRDKVLGLNEILNQAVEIHEVSSKFLQITVHCHSKYQTHNFGLQCSNHTHCL
jgi:uncharacterized protein VirK/YbjX